MNYNSYKKIKIQSFQVCVTDGCENLNLSDHMRFWF